MKQNSVIYKKLIFPGIPIFIILFIPTIYQIYWKNNTPDGFYYPGFLISDQNTYTAIFRSVIERGNGVAYSYPYSASGVDNPAIFFQLPFTLLAYLWKFSGESLFAAWEIFRYFFGIGFFILVYIFINDVFKKFYYEEFPEKNSHRKILNILFLILIFGGGLAWFVSIFQYLLMRIMPFQSETLSFYDVFISVESYGGWMLNLFRTVFHPLEMEYHFFFFLAVVGVVRKNLILIFLGQFLACISGVFVGIEISGILIFFFALEYLFTRQKKVLTNLAFSLFIFFLFIFYYKIYMMRFPIAKNLVEQHLQNLHGVIKLSSYFPAYGILLFSTPLVFLNKNFRERFFKKSEGRLLFAWLIVVAVLIQNDKFLTLKKSLQPPHFTRGYFFTALFLTTSLGIFPDLIRLSKKYATKFNVILLLMFLFFIPDNLISTVFRFVNPPHLYFLTIPKDSVEVFNFLNTIPIQENVLCPDLRLGDQIPAFTHHSSLYGQKYATPFLEDINKTMKDFFNNKNVEEFLSKYKITVLVIPKYFHLNFDRVVWRQGWSVIFENSLYKIYKINT